MRIHKKYLLAFGISILFLCAYFATFFFNTTIPKKKQIECKHFLQRFQNIKCGYFSSNISGTNHKIVGFIESKEKDRNNFIFYLRTNDSKNNEFTFKFSLVEDPIKKMLKTLTPQAEFKLGMIIDRNKLYSSQELFNQLSLNQEVIINIPTPLDNEVNKAKKIYGNIKSLNCTEYNKKIVEYLKNSTPKNLFDYKYKTLISNCIVSVIEIDIMK